MERSTTKPKRRSLERGASEEDGAEKMRQNVRAE